MHRTAVHYEILLGYMDYVKQLGYTMAHIWVCPRPKCDDYIFHCHPVEQQIPTLRILQNWCKKMLNLGKDEGIVVGYKNILEQSEEDNLRSAADLPYFEGDYWPNFLEKSIKELNQEQQKKIQSEAAEAAANVVFPLPEECKTGPDGSKSNDLSEKLLSTMKEHKNMFLAIRLHSEQSAASLGPIQDADASINCDLMDGRGPFLMLCHKKYYQFSSLRRAKYSTMCMLYEIHKGRHPAI